MSRTTQPALYEKMRNRASTDASRPSESDNVLPAVSEGPAADWFKPGRAIRLPVGYVLVAAAVILLLAIGTYTVGYRSGQSLERQRYEQAVATDAARSPDQDLTAVDPLARQPVSAGHGLLSIAAQSPPKETTRSAPPVNPDTWGPVEPGTDPRIKGQYYYVLATTKPDGAERLAIFCRKNGLETYVVPCNNKPSFRWVVAFPGFPAADRLGPRAKELADRIVAIGRKWKGSERGATDLSDFFMDPH